MNLHVCETQLYKLLKFKVLTLNWLLQFPCRMYEDSAIYLYIADVT